MEKQRKSGKFPDEVRERAVRLVRASEGSHASQWAALVSVSGKIGCTAETLRRWVREAEIDAGARPGVTADMAARVEELAREVRELRQAGEILNKASAYFAQPPPGGRRLRDRRWRGQETSAGRRSTARGGSDRCHGRAPGRVRGPADVQGSDHRPRHLARARRAPSEARPAVEAGEGGRAAMRGDPAGSCRDLRGLWRPPSAVFWPPLRSRIARPVGARWSGGSSCGRASTSAVTGSCC